MNMSATVAAPRGGAVADARRLAKSDAPSMPSASTMSEGASLNSAAFIPDERPTTPTSPVQIPVKATRHETAHPHAHAHAHAHATKHRHHLQHDEDAWRGFRRGQVQAWGTTGFRRRLRDVHSPDSISPSVAALLAVTNIPRSRSSRSLRQPPTSNGDRLSEKRMTVNSFINQVQGAEQEFSLSLSKSPLDVLLTAPEDLEDDDDEVSFSESTLDANLSTRTVSLESMPSLADSFATGTISSYDSPQTPNRAHGSVHKARPTRRSLTPVSSPPGQHDADPLSASSLDGGSDSEVDVDNLDFRVFQSPPDPLAKTTEARFPLQPLRSAFKSNLTASLRALRNAARSFSNLNLTSIPPEDFLTRSILTIDPHIPYTDERRPPPLEEEPSAALRRYLNPTQGPHVDPRLSAAQMLSPALAFASLSPATLTSTSPGPSSSTSGSATSPGSSPPRSPFTASIQMQTYRVHRTKGSKSSSSGHNSATTPSGLPLHPSGRPASSISLQESDRPPPGPRQRELRENSDFIRIAVMEMAMRRMGKLDDRKPGRARLALPPRKMGGKPYVVGTDGVPARWVAASRDGD
ncbi:hypothetical protein HMPREF1624_02472 [Sporothrix schenckii ATCC 58251]|uniref:Uncharacterized protein n=1 Tax=Sporothrix schenckii (strain ATCC 58251 / de Perez 2211183) TaxID=1391915 RepID=U7Q2I5_SPOS1|nr:hypothetical protein HMPREF1624_02472 [Sporothrix schenckii ATCC 58251]